MNRALLTLPGEKSKQQEEPVSVTSQRHSTITEKILDMDEMDRYYARAAAKKYREYLGTEKQDSLSEKITFKKYNDQSDYPITVHGPTQISIGLILLDQEEREKKDFVHQRNQSAPSAAVTAYILQQEHNQDRDSLAAKTFITHPYIQEQSLVKTTLTQQRTLCIAKQATTPTPSTQLPDKTTQSEPWLSRKSKPFDTDSPLMERLKSEDLFSLTSLPFLSPDEETESNSNNQQPLPKGALAIPQRSANKYF